MADRADITGVRISGSAKWVTRLADDIGEIPGYTVLSRAETPLKGPHPRLRAHLTVLHGYPPVSAITAWLAANGWQGQGEGLAGTLWVKTADVGRVGIPYDDSDPEITRGALERIAAAERMTVPELVAAIHVSQVGLKDG